jgi:uncharacterized iron-regulated membrane protein
MNNPDTVANTFTIGGVFAYMMQFSAELTILVLLTGLVLNILRIHDWFKNRKKKNDI